jgi:hypothetical protein
MLRVRLLGDPALEWNEAEFAFSLPPLSVVLFAMILLAGPGTRRPRDELAAALLPGDDAAVAAANLEQHRSLLTSALPDDAAYVGSDREALWWPEDVEIWCDAVAFASHPNPYAPDFMQGFAHPWISGERRRLRRLAVRDLLRQADEHSAAGDETDAIACARFAMEIDYNEVVRIGRGRGGATEDSLAGRPGDEA